MFYGFFSNPKKHRRALCSIEGIALILYLELFLLGALGKYPFTVPPTSLFFCPIVLMMSIKGIDNLKKLHPMVSRCVHCLFLIYLAVVSIGITKVVLREDFGALPLIW